MNEINKQYRDMVMLKAKDGQAILDGLTPEKAHLAHMAFGLAGELLEFNAAAFVNDRKNMIEELGDIEFYLEGISMSTSIDIAAVGLCDYSMNREDSLLVAGEQLSSLIKKYAIYNKDLDLYNIAVMYHTVRASLERAYISLGISRTEVLRANAAKLNVRYVGGYSDKQAQDRADKAGEE